jgi:hypothetical protein
MAIAIDSSTVGGWAAQSGLVFSGTVQRENAATMAVVPADAGTAVVRVDRVLKAPPVLTGLVGHQITLLPAPNSPITAGQRSVFFTRAWLYGDSLAVIEVGRLEQADDRDVSRLDAEMNEVSGLIGEADRRAADDQLTERLRRAETIVSGRVRETHPLQREQPGPVSEHDPEWWEATLEVSSTEKGEPPAGQLLTVLFPNSTDEFWIDSAKLTPGMEAIFVLQRDQAEKGFPVLRVAGLTALDPLDVHPVEALPRIRALLGRTR